MKEKVFCSNRGKRGALSASAFPTLSRQRGPAEPLSRAVPQ